jgi:hypothetical protein
MKLAQPERRREKKRRGRKEQLGNVRFDDPIIWEEEKKRRERKA